MNKDMKLIISLAQLMHILCDTTSSDIICRGCPLEQEYPEKCSDLSDEEVLKALSKYDITTLFTELPQIYISDANISHILPTLNAEINRLKEENKHLRKKADKAEKDFEALKKHTTVLENKVGEYERRICGTTWGNSVESLREKMAFLEENNKAYSELCMSLQQITDRKEIPNERAYTEHDAD